MRTAVLTIDDIEICSFRFEAGKDEEAIKLIEEMIKYSQLKNRGDRACIKLKRMP